MPPETPNNLEQQINDARRSITSDGYPMSIGELTNLYRDGELKIRPEFQRFFRWSSLQKSRLVESILLGIPLPSIFVAQAEKGEWELVDGLQRVSTILELQGELRGRNFERLPALTLNATKYLPGLEGRRWHDDDPDHSLTEAQRLDIKRSKVDIKIIRRESSPQAKYDLFQRLNSYGSALTAQEMRSALLVAVSPDFFSWLERLASWPSFQETTQLSERLLDERFDLELVIRFLVLHAWPEHELTLTRLRDLPQVLDDESIKLAAANPGGCPRLEEVFRQTFDYIAANGGDSVFRRFDDSSAEFKGSFLSTAFEVFGLGVGFNIAQANPLQQDLLEVVRRFWARPEMSGGYATGRSTERRLVEFIPIGREITARL